MGDTEKERMRGSLVVVILARFKSCCVYRLSMASNGKLHGRITNIYTCLKTWSKPVAMSAVVYKPCRLLANDNIHRKGMFIGLGAGRVHWGQRLHVDAVYTAVSSTHKFG